jgi:hypothetical protein
MSIEIPGGERLVLRRYLLGQLSPAEQDRVEEQFEDPDYFAVYQSVERGLVQDYAAGTMAPIEAELFAHNYMVTGKRRGQVAIAQALSEVYSTRWSIQSTGAASFPKWIPVLAMAASVVVGAVVLRHFRANRPVLTAIVRPVKPPSIFTSAPPEAPPPRLEKAPSAPAKATPTPKIASVPTQQTLPPAVAEPVQVPPTESSPPPISTRELPRYVRTPAPSRAPTGGGGRAMPYRPGGVRMGLPSGVDGSPGRRPAGAVVGAAIGAFLRAPMAPAAASPQGITLPIGTEIAIRTIDPIDWDTVDTSREYAASLDDPLVANGVTVAPVNGMAILKLSRGRINILRGGGMLSLGPAKAGLLISLAAITIEGQRTPVMTGTVPSRLGTPAKRTATGAPADAGGLTGQETSGQNGGNAGVTPTEKDLKIAPGTRFKFTLSQPVTIPPPPATSPPITAPPPPPSPSDAPSAPSAAPSAEVKMGQTIDQVTAILGTPTAHYDVGPKQIYTFGNMKITFTNGVVSDIQ